jgi:hypothetical protein
MCEETLRGDGHPMPDSLQFVFLTRYTSALTLAFFRLTAYRYETCVTVMKRKQDESL